MELIAIFFQGRTGDSITVKCIAMKKASVECAYTGPAFKTHHFKLGIVPVAVQTEFLTSLRGTKMQTLRSTNVAQIITLILVSVIYVQIKD